MLDVTIIFVDATLNSGDDGDDNMALHIMWLAEALETSFEYCCNPACQAKEQKRLFCNPACQAKATKVTKGMCCPCSTV